MHPTHNMQTANFITINKKFHDCLDIHSPTTCLLHKEDIDITANALVEVISEVIQDMVPAVKPSPYTKCWWTKDLSYLKKEKNRLSNLSYRLHGLPDDPIHAQHREATNKFSNRVKEVKKDHWEHWLKGANSKDIYTTNKYITSAPTDYSNTRLPLLKTMPILKDTKLASTNTNKARALAKSFFPPLPTLPLVPTLAHPKPLIACSTFTQDKICNTIHKLKPYKVPGADRIQNIIL